MCDPFDWRDDRPRQGINTNYSFVDIDYDLLFSRSPERTFVAQYSSVHYADLDEAAAAAMALVAGVLR